MIIHVSDSRYSSLESNVPRPTNTTNPSPPTTPPEIAPALDCELPVVDVGLAAAVVDGNVKLDYWPGKHLCVIQTK